jgi:predicted transposase YbfD/YdcC
VVVTADALHTQRTTAEHLVTNRKAHYVLTVKANQPTLYAACQRALSGPAEDFVPEHIAVGRGHGRTERRTTRVKALVGDEGIDFPHAAQVFRVRRDTGGVDGQRTGKEIVYCVTSLDDAKAGPARLSDLVRGHWQIENRLH